MGLHFAISLATNFVNSSELILRAPPSVTPSLGIAVEKSSRASVRDADTFDAIALQQ
jgi:hypothetical protein